MSITQFTMEEVRCFGERQTLEIRPLTFLVGENSTGKTTALACFQMLSDYLQGEGIDFNLSPYSIGIFKDIVRNSKEKEKNFKLGFASKYNNEDIEITIELVEKRQELNQSLVP
ncbi:MAG: AAA family ATPase [Candidatus Poribacteria bacterium]|nr:AAA family ATPase [Candidatus Poribacteria bacterium]